MCGVGPCQLLSPRVNRWADGQTDRKCREGKGNMEEVNGEERTGQIHVCPLGTLAPTFAPHFPGRKALLPTWALARVCLGGHTSFLSLTDLAETTEASVGAVEVRPFRAPVWVCQEGWLLSNPRVTDVSQYF